MSLESDYVPIDCSLHDHLEARATLGRTCRIRHRDSQGDLRSVTDRIVDVFAKGGEEFIETGSGLVIRLDRLASVDDVRFDVPRDAGASEMTRDPS